MPGNDLLNMALQAFQTGEFSSAACLCEEILARQPGHLQALHLSGVIASHQGHLPLAKKQLRKAAGLDSHNAAICNDLGLVHLSENNFPQAKANFEKAILLNPQMAEAHNNLGLTLKKMQDHDGARKAFLRAIEIKPDYAKAFFFLGDLHLSLKEAKIARGFFEKAIELNPGYLAAHNHLAVCHMETGDFHKSEAVLRKACDMAPDCPQTWCNLGNVQRKTHRFEQALESYRKAVALKPDFVEAHFNTALVLLLLEDFSSGWPAYEWRLKMFPSASGYPSRFGLPIWRGQDLTGKTILVYDEQGFGDAFMFCRYLAALKNTGARVVFEVRPELHQLYFVQNFADLVFPRGDETFDAGQCDYCVPLCSLAGRFFHGDRPFLPATPYIQPPPEKSAKWARRFSASQVNIGIVWSGSQVDLSRRCPPELFKSLLLSDRVALYSLQKEEQPGQAQTFPWATDLGPELVDFGDTAGILSHLDAIVTIDTAVAHLAGAMAKPTWVLLPYIPDWRWFLNRTESPWYPSVKLCRQDRSRQWSTPMDLVVQDLQRLVAQNKQGGGTRQSGATPPVDADACFNEGVELQSRGDYHAASGKYRQAIRMNPHFAQAHYNAGVCAYLEKDLKAAIMNFKKALECGIDFPSAAYNLGLAFEALGEDNKAIAAYREVITTSPDHFQSHYNLGCLLLKAGGYEEAANALAVASSLDGASWTALNNLGLAYHHLGHLDKARRSFESALHMRPDSVVTLQNLGNLYMDLKDHQKMLQCYESALSHQPGDISSQIDMGKLHQEHLNLDRADHFFRQALGIDHDCVEAHIAVGVNHLLRGDFQKGWAEMEWRLRSPKRHLTIYPYEHDKPKWNGKNFSEKTLLVHAEQGFGDTVQFARFLPLVKAMGGRVIFQVQHSLLRLLSNQTAADVVCSIEGPGEAPCDFDLFIPLMSLPYSLGIDKQDLIQESPYLRADERLGEKWKGRLDKKGLNIGLVWSGNPVHPRNTKRNIPVDQLVRLGSITGLNWYSLQMKPQPESMAALESALRITNWARDIGDFADTAGAVSSLDLVITVDTAVGHLAGALGKPVWLLLPYFPDWRWMLDRDDSPWYPSMKLFRQQSPEDWSSVTGKLSSALEQGEIRDC